MMAASLNPRCSKRWMMGPIRPRCEERGVRRDVLLIVVVVPLLFSGGGGVGGEGGIPGHRPA